MRGSPSEDAAAPAGKGAEQAARAAEAAATRFSSDTVRQLEQLPGMLQSSIRSELQQAKVGLGRLYLQTDHHVSHWLTACPIAGDLAVGVHACRPNCADLQVRSMPADFLAGLLQWLAGCMPCMSPHSIRCRHHAGPCCRGTRPRCKPSASWTGAWAPSKGPSAV